MSSRGGQEGVAGIREDEVRRSVHPLHAWVGASFVVPGSIMDKSRLRWEGHGVETNLYKLRVGSRLYSVSILERHSGLRTAVATYM
jgi:hypothetical protein